MKYLLALFVSGVSFSQDAAPSAPDKRLFGVLPNYRTAEMSEVGKPITPRQKWAIAARDSFDKPIYITSLFFAGVGHATNQYPSLGQGMQGFAKRYAFSLTDLATGNLLAEGLFPVMLHEDPRYFRLNDGSGWKRVGYALAQVVVTRTDTGARRFNYSEVLGNAGSVAFSNVYYKDMRSISDNLFKLGVQIGTDAAGNLLKEFFPDIKRKFLTRKPKA